MPSLIYIDENSQRTIFALEHNRLIVGREPHCDIRIDEDAISTEHASITFENGFFILRDLSLNGCFVNGEKVTGYTLKHNDILRFGRHLFLADLSENPVPIVLPLPPQAISMPHRQPVVGRRLTARPVAIQRGATRPLPSFQQFQYQMPLYPEKTDKINNRELLLFICLGILTVLVCYFGYQSLSHNDVPVKKEITTTAKQLTE
jgi:pSer/pThr/pTyr-binding forkhead associated (FHA) protein